MIWTFVDLLHPYENCRQCNKNERHTGRVDLRVTKMGLQWRKNLLHIHIHRIILHIYTHTYGDWDRKGYHKAAAKKLLNLWAPTPSDVAANNMVQVVLLAIVENGDG